MFLFSYALKDFKISLKWLLEEALDGGIALGFTVEVKLSAWRRHRSTAPRNGDISATKCQNLTIN